VRREACAKLSPVRRARSAAASALLVALFAPPLRADPPPRIHDMVWPADGRDVVLVTNRGLIFADAGAGRFRLMCNAALDVGVGDPPAVAFLADGRLIAATTPGLQVSGDAGCSWQKVAPLGEIQTPALAQHPADRDVLYVTSYGPGESGIRVTRNAGAAWSSAIALGDNDFTHSIAIAPSNPQRIYAAGVAFDATSMTHYVLRSSDGGGTWERATVVLGAGEERASVIAVHPNDPDELLLKTKALAPDITPERLLRSRDRGDHFEQVFSDNLLGHASYGAGGTKIWVSDAQGLWLSNDGVGNFARHGAGRWMTFALERENRLWGCGQFAGLGGGAEGVGLALQVDDPFSSWMDFRDVTEPVACGQTSATCAAAWAHWQVEVLGYSDGGLPPDGAAGDAGLGVDAGASGGAAGAAPPPAAADDGGCALATRRGPAQELVLLLLVALAARRRAARR
jgi:hypothetical protein